MVHVVQLVRASDCGSECRGFESHLAPFKRSQPRVASFFVPPRFFFFTRPVLFLRLVCDPSRLPKRPLPPSWYVGRSKGCQWRGAMGRRLTGALCFSSYFVLFRPHDHSADKVVTGANILLPRFFYREVKPFFSR